MTAPPPYQFVKDFLSNMAKWRMADVVGEGCGLSYFRIKAAKMVKQLGGVSFFVFSKNFLSKTAGDLSYFD